MGIGDNTDIMRQIIAMLIAILALAVIMPAMCAQVTNPPQPAPLLDPGQTALEATQSMAAFLNENWKSPSVDWDPLTAIDTKKKSTTQNINKTKPANTSSKTYALQDFLSDSWKPGPFVESSDLIQTAGFAKKGSAVKQTEYAIYQFLDDSWIPPNQVNVFTGTATGYNKHKIA